MTNTSDLELPLAAVRRQRRAMAVGSPAQRSMLRAEHLIEVAIKSLAQEAEADHQHRESL